MHYNFLFNGCSITYGDELEDVENYRFSHLIAKHFNKTHDNIAVGGSSNDGIAERTINWFEEGNTCDFAIIQWTFKDRVDWYRNTHDPTHYPTQHSMGPNYKVDISDYKLAQAFYYKTFYTDYLGNQNLYKNIFFLKTYFQLKQIKHYFFGISRGVSYNKGWQLYCDPLFTLIEDAEEFTLQHNPKYQCVGRHPNEIGHQVIANYLIPNIEL